MSIRNEYFEYASGIAMSDQKNDPSPLLQFPCNFPIKMMGRNKAGFIETVIEIVGQHAGSIPQDTIRTSVSSKKAFLSVTITINAESQDQLDRIYEDLSAHEDVMVSL